MSVDLSQAGIRVELDVNRLGEQIAKRVAEHLAHLFPQDATDFWVALCEQAHRERQRVAARAARNSSSAWASMPASTRHAAAFEATWPNSSP
jgi:hypothetical protein